MLDKKIKLRNKDEIHCIHTYTEAIKLMIHICLDKIDSEVMTNVLKELFLLSYIDIVIGHDFLSSTLIFIEFCPIL